MTNRTIALLVSRRLWIDTQNATGTLGNRGPYNNAQLRLARKPKAKTRLVGRYGSIEGIEGNKI